MTIVGQHIGHQAAPRASANGKPSGLAKLFGALASGCHGDLLPALAERDDIQEKLASSHSWSEVLRHANALAALAEGEIQGANSTKGVEQAIADCEQRTGGIHPVRFYSLVRYYERICRGRKSNLARQAALLRLRPELFEAKIGTPEARRSRDEIDRISKIMKNLMERPARALRPWLALADAESTHAAD